MIPPRANGLKPMMNFIVHNWKDSRLAPLIAYPRYMWFVFMSRTPTVFYDKLFTSSYQPFVTRNNLLLLLGMVGVFKYNISQRRKEGLDQQPCCCITGCPMREGCPFAK